MQMISIRHNGFRVMFILLFLLLSNSLCAQYRPFDNSRAIAPWIYNPSASFATETQVYLGYDGRGSNSQTPQTLMGGLRFPVLYAGRDRRRPAAMAGVQYLKVTQDILNHSVISGNFAYQVPISRRVRAALGVGSGISTLKYNYEKLVYLDASDPLIGSGVNFFNIHLNAGISVVLDEKLTLSLSNPYMLKENKLNIREIIARATYKADVSENMSLLIGANVDTYNRNQIIGGDLRAAWKKSFTVIAGADNYKFYSGLSVSMDYLTIGYTYGYNYSKLFSNFANNQIVMLIEIPQKQLPAGQ